MNNKINKNKEKILNDPDFIHSPTNSNSLNEFVIKNDEGVDDSYASKVLMMTEEEFRDIYEEAIENLKKLINGESNG